MSTALQPIPFVNFNGNCAEAMRFYADVFGGTIKVMMSVSQSPIAAQLPEGSPDFILNAQLELPGGGYLYGGDCPPHIAYEGMRGVSLTLNYDTVEKAEAIFNRLADGGQIGMPFEPMFWAEKFGMVTDRYGVDWLINGVLKYS